MADKDYKFVKVTVESSNEEYVEVTINLTGSADALVYTDSNGDFKRFNNVLISAGTPGEVRFNCEVAINNGLSLANLSSSNGTLLAISGSVVVQVPESPAINDLTEIGTAQDGEARQTINAILDVLRDKNIITV